MSKSLPIMVQGTHSDAGKSIIVTGLCRLFKQKGYKTSPFKSQNMALNSYITWDGKEIGRAQGVQAEAAGIVADTNMNPILIKPTRDSEAQIVVHGVPQGNLKATDYRKSFYEQGLKLINDAYTTLSNDFERIVIEGAGSPAEVNLNDRELVNMRVAKIANAPVILVGDIEKGGVFASLVGTLQLLSEDERERVIGVVINKFRGDKTLLEPGLKWFEEYTGKKVLGVVPYISDLTIDAEDSVALDHYTSKRNEIKAIDIAVIRYPRISNFTDIDPFIAEEDCHVRFIKNAGELGTPDLIILPGSKNTIEDYLFMKEKKIADEIINLAKHTNVQIFGICGGFQMLGTSIDDPNHIESTINHVDALNLLPVKTVLTNEKKTIRNSGIAIFNHTEFHLNGYEIHMGRSTVDAPRFIATSNGQDGCKVKDDSIIGTYFHGIFHNDDFRHHFLNCIRIKKDLPEINDRIYFEKKRQEAFDKLAEHLNHHLDIEYIEEKMKEWNR